MLKLQSEMANIVFEGTAPNAKTWDVINKLRKLNLERGNVADAELKEFSSDCFRLQNLIRAEISGNKGETYTAKSLDRVKSSHIVLRNVEIERNGVRTELDFIVITNKAIFIIEVKNTQKNVFISDGGGFYKNGDYKSYDSNILKKMKLREQLLGDTLRDAGIFNTNIESILVFTNNKIEIQNHCKELDVAFLDQLPYKIDGYKGWQLYSEDTFTRINEFINEKTNNGVFYLDLDIDKFKKDFEAVMYALNCKKAEPDSTKRSLIEMIVAFFNIKLHKTVV